MWSEMKITEFLGIRYPILLGPMGGGFGTTNLLAIVSNAGGLGSFGAYTLTPEEIMQIDKEIKEKTNKPYNINLWVSDVDSSLKDYPDDKINRIKELFKPYFDELDIPLPELSAQIPSKFEDQAEMILKIRPAVFSFIFGIPSEDILKKCRQFGIRTIGSATTLDEALALEAADVDAIVAAGFEAGGHRPSFLRPAEDSLTGTFSLLQQLKNKIKKPVIAAGGIVDGKGVAAALTLGADAVQIGTAFLACDESNAVQSHRQLLFSEQAKYTVLSKSMTGRMGRTLRNRITEDIDYQTEVLPFPLQTRLLAPLKSAAINQGRTDLVNFWSGQSAVSLKYKKADDLMNSLIGEASAVINSSS